MKKNTFILITLLTFGIAAWCYFVCTTHNDSGNGAIYPLEVFEPEAGSSVYLFLSPDDLAELPESVPHNKRLYCDDVRVLEELKNYFVFVPSGGDAATCESKVVVYDKDLCVFQSAIVIQPGMVGLQGEKTGWADAKYPEKLIQLFSEFRECKP